MIVALLAGLAAVTPQDSEPVRLVDGGLCTGLAWIEVPAGAKATVTRGPDFSVLNVEWGGKTAFGVYVGGFPQVSADKGKPLLENDGLTVRASHVDGAFRGYIVGNADYLKNHFFGPAFKDNGGDATFFRRALFGKAAAAKCNRSSGASK